MSKLPLLSLILNVAFGPSLLAFVSAYSPSPLFHGQLSHTPGIGKKATFLGNIPQHPSSTSALFNSADDSATELTIKNDDSETSTTNPTNATILTPATLKQSLLENVKQLQTFMELDGDFSIDFGVKGGELNQTSRAPQKVDYYTM